MYLWTSDDYSTQTLKPNYIYKVQVNINGEIKEWKFYTKFNPYYTTKRKVLSDLRLVLKNIPDGYIDLLIHENSVYVSEIASETVLDEIQSGNIPSSVERYVRHKTQLDIVKDLLIANSMQAGATEKLLGDFKIMYEIKTPDLEKILDMLEPRVDRLERALSETGISASAVRAGANPYPYEGRATFRGAGE